jgi:hypothetical protein
LYAARQPQPLPRERTVVRPANALSPAERATVWETLSHPRFADQTPYEIVPQLLDEGRYLGSIRTDYRVLAENQAFPERRNVLRRPTPAIVPRLTATRPLQVWTWDTLAPRLRAAQVQVSPNSVACSAAWCSICTGCSTCSAAI